MAPRVILTSSRCSSFASDIGKLCATRSSHGSLAKRHPFGKLVYQYSVSFTPRPKCDELASWLISVLFAKKVASSPVCKDVNAKQTIINRV